MTRNEFLSTLGAGALFALSSTCLGGCKKDETTTPGESIDFTLDLTEPSNAALQNNGGYVIKNKVVVARNTDGEYVAATLICSHEQENEIIMKNNEWFCTAHDARFDLDGSGLNEKGEKGLTIYNTELTGDILQVFS